MKIGNHLIALRQVRSGKEAVTMIEAEIRSASTTTYQFNQEHSGHRSFPVFVDREVWKRALALDQDAIAEANTRQPGCIYHNATILAEIERQTAIAAHGVDKTEVYEAKAWLERVCRPRSMQTDRAALSPQHLNLYPYLYEDIRVIREICAKLRGTLIEQERSRWRRLREVFPDLEHTPPEWLRVICRMSDEEGKFYAPVDAADWVLGQITHYSAREIRKVRRLFFNPEEWKRVKKLREDSAKSRIADILNTSGPTACQA